MQLTAVRCGVGASYLSFVTAHFMSELVYLDERGLCRVSAPSCFDKNHLAHGGTAVVRCSSNWLVRRKRFSVTFGASSDCLIAFPASAATKSDCLLTPSITDMRVSSETENFKRSDFVKLKFPASWVQNARCWNHGAQANPWNMKLT